MALTSSERRRRYYKSHRDAVLAYNKEYRKNNRSKFAAYSKVWRQKHREELLERQKEYQKKYIDNNTDVSKSHSKVHAAIKQGRLVKKPCEICGEKIAEAHHDDYSKPLDVRWLCKKCHAKWHMNNKPIKKGD